MNTVQKAVDNAIPTVSRIIEEDNTFLTKDDTKIEIWDTVEFSSPKALCLNRLQDILVTY